MVLGNSSRFTEGFTSFTADDELMIANLKQALNYSKESVAIPDPSINITNSTINSTTNPTTNPATTKANVSSINSNMRRMNNNLPSNISSMSSIMPTSTPSFTIPIKPFPTNTGMDMENSMRNEVSVGISTTPQMTMTNSTRPEILDTSTTASMANFKNVQKFNDIKRVMNDGNEDDEVNSDDENAVLEETEQSNPFENDVDKHSTIRKNSNNFEGFRGSMDIESKQTRNILLALLLSCIGYLVVYSMGNNLLPIDEISPQLKKFKRLVYAGLFFLITYICLEVF